MTEQELREKIVKIALNTSWTDMFGDHYSIGESAANAIADALIAAGIGDVSELKKHRVVVEKSLIPEEDNAYALPNIPPTVKQLYSGEEVEQIVKERDEYKHRAEVTERAIKIADKLGELCGRKEDYVQQAEKEFAEERKDD